MIRKSAISSFILFFTMIIVSFSSYADLDNSSNVIVSTDPIHPYIHEIMKSSNSDIKIVDENQNDITDEIKSKISNDYLSGNYDSISKYLNTRQFNFFS